MFGLIYKELITHKKQLLAILPVLIFFIGFSVIPPITTPDLTEIELEFVLILCSIMVMITLTLFEQGVFEADEIKRWQSYIASAPDGIRKQIGSKYIFNALLSCVTVSILTVAFSIASCINETEVNISDMLLYQLLWLQFLINAVEIPFLVRFGSKHGNEFLRSQDAPCRINPAGKRLFIADLARNRADDRLIEDADPFFFNGAIQIVKDIILFQGS